MPGTHHLQVDALQYLGREQLQVVLERLQLVLRRIRPISVAQHLAQSLVLVGQFLDAVVVGVQAQAQHAQHQDSPLLHPRAAHSHIGPAFALCT